MAIEAHDPKKHPVDCPECQRMFAAYELNVTWEHSQSGPRGRTQKGEQR